MSVTQVRLSETTATNHIADKKSIDMSKNEPGMIHFSSEHFRRNDAMIE